MVGSKAKKLLERATEELGLEIVSYECGGARGRHKHTVVVRRSDGVELKVPLANDLGHGRNRTDENFKGDLRRFSRGTQGNHHRGRPTDGRQDLQSLIR